MRNLHQFEKWQLFHIYFTVKMIGKYLTFFLVFCGKKKENFPIPFRQEFIHLQCHSLTSNPQSSYAQFTQLTDDLALCATTRLKIIGSNSQNLIAKFSSVIPSRFLTDFNFAFLCFVLIIFMLHLFSLRIFWISFRLLFYNFRLLNSLFFIIYLVLIHCKQLMIVFEQLRLTLIIWQCIFYKWQL